MQQRSRQVTLLGLALITLCAFAIRMYRLDTQSLWYDEGVTAEVAQRGITQLTQWTAGDIQPPLYYYLIALEGRLAGWSEWNLRFPSVFFGTLMVPLLAAVTIALTRRRFAGLLAALFVTFHPLLVYYSQEARMYAMLTTLGVLLGYLILHAETRIHNKWLHWTVYIIVATAAVYTHYFAFFLLLALAFAFFADQLLILARPIATGDDSQTQALPSQLVRGAAPAFLLADLAVLVLYLPWITAMLTRFAVDSSYWQGQFKLWEAVRHVAISFTSGETVLEVQATRLLLPYGLTVLAVLPVLTWRNPAQRRTLVYGLLWLALPILAVLLLAMTTPKFNPRYVMIALPGLLLLWSAGLAQLATAFRRRHRSLLGMLWLRSQSIFSMAIIGLLLTGFVYADYNWFSDPAFTKAEWRQLSQYVRAQIKAEQAKNQNSNPLIILVSGHAWPVWHYYAPDLPPLRLPNIEILDVNAVLDFTRSALPLRNALRGKTDVWLIEWQEKVVDPMTIVPLQLQLAGHEAKQKTQFWHLQLHHYTNIHADGVLVEPSGATDSSTNFGNQVNLLDYRVAANGDLLLVWQLNPNHSNPVPDLYVTGQIYTQDGLPFSHFEDRRLANYEFPTFRWRQDQITVGRIPASEWTNLVALPGTYRLRLGVYDVNGDLSGLDVIGKQGQPLGRNVMLDLPLSKPTKGPDIVDKVTFAQIIKDLYVEISLPTEQAEPGELVGSEIHWYAEEKVPGDYDLLVRWRLRSDNEIVGEETIPLAPKWRTSRWPDDELIRTLVQFRPPLNLAPDDYWLEIGLTAPTSTFVRVPFRVLGSTRVFRPPPYATKIDVIFNRVLHLLGVIEPIQIQSPCGRSSCFDFGMASSGQNPDGLHGHSPVVGQKI